VEAAREATPKAAVNLGSLDPIKIEESKSFAQMVIASV
jgi:hypothetical protein